MCVVCGAEEPPKEEEDEAARKEKIAKREAKVSGLSFLIVRAACVVLCCSCAAVVRACENLLPGLESADSGAFGSRS